MFSDFSVATAVALIFLLLSWLWGRTTSAGKPLNPFQRRLLVYGFFFVLGMGYIMALVADLKWPMTWLFPAIVCWGVLLSMAAWCQYRRQKRDSHDA